MTHPARSTSTAASRRGPFIVGGVLLLAVIAGITLALVLNRSPETASGDQTPTPTPSASPVSSPSDEPAAPSEPAVPSDSPTAAPEPSEGAGPAPVVVAPDGVLPPGSVVRVVADGLRVRQEPTRGAEQVGTLSRGELVLLGYSFLHPAFGPVEADGFVWYPVSPLGVTELPDPEAPLESEVVGWAAVGDGTDPWVELVPPRCVEGDPDLALLSSLTEWERLACYGDRSLTIEGVKGCGGCGGLYPGTFEPSWLATPMNYEFLSVEPQERIGPFLLRFSPDGPERPSEPGVAPILRVTGHFDDAAAAGCMIARPTDEPIDEAVAELYCRQQFVVESYEILGIDEDFPFG
jgi:hypothetical protein